MARVSSSQRFAPDGSLQGDDPRRNLRALIVGIVVFAALAIACALWSDGFLEGDACTHFSLARFAFKHLENLLDVWGRPLCTGIYAVPAILGGRFAVQMTSLGMAILCGIAVYRIASKQGYRLPALASILLFAQPVFFLHSWSELTEIPFATVMILAFWAFQSRQFLIMALLVGMTPMGRPEGFGLMLLAAMALVMNRRWYYIALLPMWLVAWTFFGWLEETSRLGPVGYPWYWWLPKNWPYAARSMYGNGPIYHFVGMLPILVSPLMFPMLAVGMLGRGDKGTRGQGDKEMTKRSEKREAGSEKEDNTSSFSRDPKGSASAAQHSALSTQHSQSAIGNRQSAMAHRSHVDFAILAIPLMVLVVHSLLWWRGLMASNGELRYLLSVSPLWALLTARGFEWIWQRLNFRAPFLWAAAFAVVPMIADIWCPVVPLKMHDRDRLAYLSAQWYRQTPGLANDYPLVMSTHPAVYYWLDVSHKDPARARQFRRKTVEEHPPGLVLFWDEEYGLRNSDQNMVATEQQVRAAGWVRAGEFVSGKKTCSVWLSPETGSGAKTEPGKYRAGG